MAIYNLKNSAQTPYLFLFLTVLLSILEGILGTKPAYAIVLPPGFSETTVFSGLINPTAIEFAADGRVFVAEKRGVVKVYDNLSDTTPTDLIDLRTEVYNFWDRGLLGLALHPNFPTKPYVYLLYTYDFDPNFKDPNTGQPKFPRWGAANSDSDPCSNPPGANTDGCVVSGRLARLELNPATGAVLNKVNLIDNWCQQYPSHSVGDLAFGSDGALYVSAGDGASFTFADFGQKGSPLNPCGDPPGNPGTQLTAPSAEGGALRAQDLRTSGDPVGLNGAILRLDENGVAMSDNPLAGNADANARRVVAHGLRNPFRFALRTVSGTTPRVQVWIGDVGYNTWEELDLLDGLAGGVRNFGWPCYEGNASMVDYDAANLAICENLYAASPSAVAAPVLSYNHSAAVVSGDGCTAANGSSVSGLAFYPESGATNPYPADYNGALFFSDYSRRCIWVMGKGGGAQPTVSQLRAFANSATDPVQLKIGPGGDLYYVAFNGSVRRIVYSNSTQNPLPAPWLHGDIGAVGVVGNATYSSGVFSVQGSGADIWGTSDRFHYAYQSLTGDGTITARVSGIGATDAWAKAGVMIRDGLGANARHVAMYLTAGNGLAFQRRLTTGGTSAHTDGGAGNAPVWVRLTRSGSTFTGYRSADGTTWTAVGSVTIAMGSTVNFGLAVTSHNNTVLNSSSFDNVIIAAGPPAANNTAPVATINPVAINGSTSTTAWKVGDNIQFSGSAVDPEDGTLPAQSLSWEVIMHHCITGLTGCHTHLISTHTGNGPFTFAAPDHEYPSYLELKLTATDFAGGHGTASVQMNPQTANVNFASVPSGLQLNVGGVTRTTPFAVPQIVGTQSSLAINAPSPQTQGQSSYVFDAWSDGGAQAHNVVGSPATYTATYTASANPWTDADIGTVGAAGGSSSANGAISVTGSGADIWGAADAFHYLYRPMNGDGTITARVTGVGNTNAWAKAGVMIRETLAANSRHASTFLTPANGVSFQRRTTTGGTSASTSGGAATAPTWVRLVRAGSTFSSYRSSDGVNWTLIGTSTITMASSVYVGLAVTSHSAGVLNTSTFENVQ